MIKFSLFAASVDGLVEASRQSRVCAGAANDIACMIFRVLMEVRSHSRFRLGTTVLGPWSCCLVFALSSRCGDIVVC
jgi:hypothetical protein